MNLNYLNPFFYLTKIPAILKRLSEIPENVLWRLLYPFRKSGYLFHPDTGNIDALKDIHKGKVGFLIGNGPSVRVEDLEKIDHGVAFCANRFYLAFDKMTFRPNYMVSSDEQMIKDFGQEITDTRIEAVFTSPKRPNQIRGRFTWIKLFHGRPFRFGYNPHKGLMAGGGSLNFALQMGFHMGIRKFYMYGIDHNFNFKKIKGQDRAEGDNNHFISGYRSSKTWIPPRMGLVEESLKKCDKVLRKLGGFVKNATRGGKLEVLERVDFDEICE